MPSTARHRLDIDWHAGSRSAVHSAPPHLTAVVFPASGPQFVVEPRGKQEPLAGWGDLLGQYVVERGVVSPPVVVDLARPSGMADHIAWLSSDRTRRPLQQPAAASYRELLEVGTSGHQPRGSGRHHHRRPRNASPGAAPGWKRRRPPPPSARHLGRGAPSAACARRTSPHPTRSTHRAATISSARPASTLSA